MFAPVSLKGKIFKQYLKSFAHPAKIRIQNIFGRTLFKNGLVFKQPGGAQFSLDANDWITRIFLLEGDYESASTSLAKKIMTAGGVFVDIGANFGLFTCQVAAINRAVQVIAVEPNYKIIGTLLRNIQLNDLKQQVKVLNMAVSGKAQLLNLEQPAADNLGTTQTVAGSVGEFAVLSCSLDFILEKNFIKTIELLKIDIEGNEFDILYDFPFEKYTIRNIILEFNHLSKISFNQMQAFFTHKGYECYTVDGAILNEAHQPIPENNIWLVKQ